MSKKRNLKQHLFMIILFLCGNLLFTSVFFSKGVKEQKKNLSRQISEARNKRTFLTGHSSKEKFSIKELEDQVKELTEQNRVYNESLFGSVLKVLSVNEKVKIITENALLLNLEVEHSATSLDNNETYYQLKFYSPFKSIVELINKSYRDLGDLNIRSISMKNESGVLKTTLEFKL